MRVTEPKLRFLAPASFATNSAAFNSNAYFWIAALVCVIALGAASPSLEPRPGAAMDDWTPIKPNNRLVPVAAAREISASQSARGDTVDPFDSSGAYFDETTDRDERLIVFSPDGSLQSPYDETLREFARLMHTAGTSVVAEACEPDGSNESFRLKASIHREFWSAGLVSWSMQSQPIGCALPGGVVIRAGQSESSEGAP